MQAVEGAVRQQHFHRHSQMEVLDIISRVVVRQVKAQHRYEAYMIVQLRDPERKEDLVFNTRRPKTAFRLDILLSFSLPSRPWTQQDRSFIDRQNPTISEEGKSGTNHRSKGPCIED